MSDDNPWGSDQPQETPAGGSTENTDVNPQQTLDEVQSQDQPDPYSDQAWAEYDAWLQQDSQEIPESLDVSSWEDLGAEQAAAADRLVEGHSLAKHQGEYPGSWSMDDLRDHVSDVINHPSDVRDLQDDRKAFWDDDLGTVVILNPHDQDGGTFYRPADGKDHFDLDLT